MQNIPPDKLTQIKTALNRPEGTFFFVYHSNGLFNPSLPGGIVFENISGKHFYRLERDQEMQLHFFYSSPGTGTRVATIDLKSIEPSDQIKIMLSWCPEETQLLAGTSSNINKAISAKGVASEKQFQVGKGDVVTQIGDHGIQVAGVHFYQGNVPIIQPTALDSWRETLKALEILSTGQSDEGFIYEVVVTNLTLSMLATGFETYTKKRFIEIQHEGMTANCDAILNSFLSRRERTAESKEILIETAKNSGCSVAELFAENGTINFQNYEKCKLAYNKAYGIKFGNLQLAGDRLTKLKAYLGYRHKIVHVSPLMGCLNLEKAPSEKLAIPNQEMAQAARACFTDVIEKLHKSTLDLRPNK